MSELIPVQEESQITEYLHTSSQQRQEKDVNEVIPRFKTEVFRGRESAAFYVGILATTNEVVDTEAWHAARVLRANVYIDEMAFLPESSRHEDGGEEDEDDQRSIQFGVYENQGVDGEARLVGTSRLIVKRDTDDLLPAERIYPDVFADRPAEVDSVETSRVIARHADKKITRKAVSLAMIRAMAAWSITEQKQPVYAVIDPSVKRMYDRMEFPYEQLSDLRYTEEYQSENWAVQIEPHNVVNLVKPGSHSSALMKAFFEGVQEHKGLGYYDAYLTNRIEQ